MSGDNKTLVVSGGMPLAMTVTDVMGQIQAIQQLMDQAMTDGEHYGTIPGCGSKKTLMQPGAQKLCLMFGLAPAYAITKSNYDGGHREYEVLCSLTTRAGVFLGQGSGAATTMEEKFRYRGGSKKPTGRPVPKKYWNMRDKNPKAAQELLGGNGFGVGKVDGQYEIVEKGTKMEHDNPADFYNTVNKIACKRALVAAVNTVLAASDIFTQDIEDNPTLFGGKTIEADSSKIIEAEIIEPEEKKTKTSTVEAAKEPKPEGDKKDTIQRKLWNELAAYVKVNDLDKAGMEIVMADLSEWKGTIKTIADIPDLSDGRARTILGKLRRLVEAESADVKQPEQEDVDDSDPFKN